MKGDTAALERIWADDYTFINASGAVLTKAERLANQTSGATKLGTIEMQPDMKIRVYGGGVAVAINRVTLKEQYIGAAIGSMPVRPGPTTRRGELLRRSRGNHSAVG